MMERKHNWIWHSHPVTIALDAVLLCFAVDAASGAAAAVAPLSDAVLAKIRFDQNLNSQVSWQLPFRDEAGKAVVLGDYFGAKPVILDLGYYGCPMLCTLVLNGLVESLQDLKPAIGNEFEVLNVSIDPHETSNLAAAKKRTYLKRYGRRGAAAGWHFLTGDEAAIKALAEEVGFHYAYDPTVKQYAHPSGIIILTPQGTVARCFLGITFPPKELDAALKQAAANQIGSPIEQFILLCFSHSPLTGKYGPLIMTIVRVSGAATLAGLLGLIALVSRRSRSSQHAPENAGNPAAGVAYSGKRPSEGG